MKKPELLLSIIYGLCGLLILLCGIGFSTIGYKKIQKFLSKVTDVLITVLLILFISVLLFY